MPTDIEKIAAKARSHPEMVFTSLAHHITSERLWENLQKIPRGTSTGIDGQDVRAAKRDFSRWSGEMLLKLHHKGYRAPLSRRVYIPKPGRPGQKRPIAVPTVQDRCLQKTVADILNSIYEADFLPCSYGGRPKRSAHQAIADVSAAIGKHKVNFIVEADLKNFFGSLDHRWVERFLKHRVGDPRINKLIYSWLKAGVMESGAYVPTETGTAQGGPISVLISNLYLHYVLDLWIEKVVKPRMRGEVYYFRYLDDFILGFQYQDDSKRFMAALPQRLSKFKLSLEPSKTRTLKFGRLAQRRQGPKGKENKSFNFLGFCFYNSRSKQGKYKVGRKTEKSRYQRACHQIKELLRGIRHQPVPEQRAAINRHLRGHYNYYGVADNSQCIANLYYLTVKYWRKTLSSRSQKGKVTWERYRHLLKVFPLCPPKLKLPYEAMDKLATL